MTKSSSRRPASWPRSLVITACLILGLVGITSVGDKPRPSPRIEATAPIDLSQPTSEERNWFKEHVIDVLNTQALSYPVESIRAQLLAGRVKVRSGEVRENVDRLGTYGGEAVLAAGLWGTGNQRLLSWSFPAVQRLHAECGQRYDLYVDMLVMTFLHELFHLYAQPPYNPRRLRSEAVENELEAWWWVLKNVADPMRANGRLTELVSNKQRRIFAAYAAAQGDPQSPAWHQIGDELTLH